jgi:hypothetical protein
MKKNLTIALLLISCIVWGQDPEWKPYTIDNLTVPLPGEITRIDTTFLRNGITMDAVILNTNQEGYALTVSVIGGMEKSNDSEAKLLKDVGEGFCKGAQRPGISCVIADTTIDHLTAKKGELRSIQFGESGGFTSYMIVFNDKLYSLGAATTDTDEKSLLMIKKFMDGIDFNNAAKVERKGKWYNLGTQVGKIIGAIVGVAAFIFLFVFLSKRNKAKTQTHIS